MAKTIVGVFEHFSLAQGAVQELVNRGFERGNISVLAGDNNQALAHSLGQKADTEAINSDDRHVAVKGMVDLVVGLGAFTVQGIGHVIGGGPVMASIGGVGQHYAGGLVGAMQASNIPEDEAITIAGAVRQGAVLVMVYTSDEQADAGVDILNRYQPLDHQQMHAYEQAHPWTGFNEGSEPFAFQGGRTVRPRSPQSDLDYGPGARAFLSGKPVADYARDEGNPADYVIPDPEAAVKKLEPLFRRDFEQKYASQGKLWDDLYGAYRFGFDKAHESPEINQNWEQVAPHIQEDWEMEHIGQPWSDYAHAVQVGWEAVQNQK